MNGPFEARKMIPGCNSYFACGHSHATFAEGKACRDRLYPGEMTAYVRPVAYRPRNLQRFVERAQ